MRRQGTLNLSIFPFDNVRIRVSGLYSELNKSSLAGGNNIFGVFSLGLMGQLRLADDNNRYGSLAFATLRETAERDIFEDVEHFAGSVNANWTIMDGMVFDGTFGVDVTNGTNVSFFPFGWNVDSFTTYNTEGTRSFGDRNHREVTGDFKVSYDNSFTDDITSTLLVGTQGFLSQNVYHGGGGTELPGSRPGGRERRSQPVDIRGVDPCGQRRCVLPGAGGLAGLGVRDLGRALRRQQRVRLGLRDGHVSQAGGLLHPYRPLRLG